MSGDASQGLMPIRHIQPTDFGGIVARQGFAYQDHVAALFCIDSIQNAELKEVWCETYDDIVVVWEKNGLELIEFVQVKAEMPDQLWTPAMLCERKKKAGEKEKQGTSIPEKSLARDCCKESSRFRLVTSWELNSELRLLKHDLDHQDRHPDKDQFKTLSSEVKSRIGDFRSGKGDDCESWLKRTKWDVYAEEALKNNNCYRLLEAMEALALPTSTDAALAVYSGLLGLVKDAAEKPDSKRSEKFLKREQIINFIKEQAAPFPGLGPSEILDRKLSQADLPETEKQTAQDLRRQYLTSIRSRSFYDTGGSPPFAAPILHRLLRLRAAYDSGSIQPKNGVEFHAKCLESVDEVMADASNNASHDSIENGAGCMYEITARCKHRFVRYNS